MFLLSTSRVNGTAGERLTAITWRPNPSESGQHSPLARDGGTSPEPDWARHPSRSSVAPRRATDETGPTGRIMSESGRALRSRNDWAGSAGPRPPVRLGPSLSLALAGLLARPSVVGSRPAPYCRAAHLCRRLISTL